MCENFCLEILAGDPGDLGKSEHTINKSLVKGDVWKITGVLREETSEKKKQGTFHCFGEEKTRGTCYCSVLLFDSSGDLMEFVLHLSIDLFSIRRNKRV